MEYWMTTPFLPRFQCACYTIFVGSIVLAGVVVGRPVAAIFNEDGHDPIVVNVEIKLGRAENQLEQPIIDLGLLEGRQEHVIDVHFFNTLDDSLVFATIKAGCSCTHIEAVSHEFPAGQKSVVRLKLVTPKSTPEQGFTSTFTFMDADDLPVLNVVVRFRLRGNLAVDRSGGNVLELVGEAGRWRIPIFFTEPILFENLQIDKVTSGLSGLAVALQADKSGSYLVISASSEKVDDNGLTGTITITDEVQGISCDAEFLVSKRALVVVSPVIMGFRVQDEILDTFLSNVLLKVTPDIDGNVSKLTQIKCVADGDSLKIESKELGNGIYRLRVIASANQLETQDDEYGKLTWELLLDNGQSLIVSGLFFRR